MVELHYRVPVVIPNDELIDASIFFSLAGVYCGMPITLFAVEAGNCSLEYHMFTRTEAICATIVGVDNNGPLLPWGTSKKTFLVVACFCSVYVVMVNNKLLNL